MSDRKNVEDFIATASGVGGMKGTTSERSKRRAGEKTSIWGSGGA